MAKKYYWLKLTRDFFKRHDTKILLKKDKEFSFCLFYLMLLLESIDHDGSLRFSEDIPYDAELLSDVFDFSADDITESLALYKRLGLVEELPDGTILMKKLEGMIGSESESAERVRRLRENQKALHCNADVTECNASVTKCNTEKEKDIEKDLDKEKELECNSDANTRIHTFGKHFNVFLTDDEYEKIKKEIPLSYEFKIDYFSEYLFRNPDKHYDDHCSTIIKWHRNDVADSLAEMRRAIKERPDDE